MTENTTHKILYTYTHPANENTGELDVAMLSAYAESIVFDRNRRNIWHYGAQYGNAYWGSSYGESFNDFATNSATGDYSHAEGSETNASGNYSHAEGIRTIASGEGSSSIGGSTRAMGNYSHAEGIETAAEGEASHAEGAGNFAFGESSHAEGGNTRASGDCSHTEGSNTQANGESSHAEGNYSIASANYAHAEGLSAQANGEYSHSEGGETQAYGIGSHAEGQSTVTNKDFSHAEGSETKTNADFSHAEGIKTSTLGIGAHSEGYKSRAEGEFSHSEGVYTEAHGVGSLAIGNESKTEAAASYSMASGVATETNGEGSFATGYKTLTRNSYETSVGFYNNSIESTKDTAYGGTLFTIGNGISNVDRHNVIDVRKNGEMWKNGSSYFNDDIYGPVSYTYVQSLGPTAKLDIVLSSLLEQPQYTKPVLYYNIYRPKTGLSSVSNSWSGWQTSAIIEDTIEVGRPWSEYIAFNWPDRTLSSKGTRMNPSYFSGDPSKLPGNYVLGYSYGLDDSNAISFYYINQDGDTAGRTGIKSYTGDLTIGGSNVVPVGDYQINVPNDFDVLSDIKMGYMYASYMYFQQLYDKNVYVNALGTSPTNWFNNGVLNIPGVRHRIHTRYKLYWGFVGDVYDSDLKYMPSSKAEVIDRAMSFSFLNHGTTTITIPLKNYSASEKKYSFFIATPEYLSISKLGTNGHTINVLQPDGVSFDLVTSDQVMYSKTIGNFPLGSDLVTTTYKIYFVNFQNPIGNPNDTISFTIIQN